MKIEFFTFFYSTCSDEKFNFILVARHILNVINKTENLKIFIEKLRKIIFLSDNYYFYIQTIISSCSSFKDNLLFPTIFTLV